MSKPKQRTWLVWEADYPEEGSWEYRATSAQAAKARYRKDTGESDMELRAALMTPEIRAARRHAT